MKNNCKVTKGNFNSLVNEVGISRREVESILQQLKSAKLNTIIPTDVVYGEKIIHYYFRRCSTFSIELIAVVEHNGEDVVSTRRTYTVANVFPTRIKYYYEAFIELFNEMKELADSISREELRKEAAAAREADEGKEILVWLARKEITVDGGEIELELFKEDNGGYYVIATVKSGEFDDEWIRESVTDWAWFFCMELTRVEVRKEVGNE